MPYMASMGLFLLVFLVAVMGGSLAAHSFSSKPSAGRVAAGALGVILAAASVAGFFVIIDWQDDFTREVRSQAARFQIPEGQPLPQPLVDTLTQSGNDRLQVSRLLEDGKKIDGWWLVPGKVGVVAMRANAKGLRGWNMYVREGNKAHSCSPESCLSKALQVATMTVMTDPDLRDSDLARNIASLNASAGAAS